MSQATTTLNAAIEPDPRRIHVLFGGHSVANSTAAAVVREDGQRPVWYFPRQDVEMAVLTATSPRAHAGAKGPVTYFTIYRDASVIENAAWSFENPPPPFQSIAGRIAFNPAHFDLAADGRSPAEWAAEQAGSDLPS